MLKWFAVLTLSLAFAGCGPRAEAAYLLRLYAANRSVLFRFTASLLWNSFFEKVIRR